MAYILDPNQDPNKTQDALNQPPVLAQGNGATLNGTTSNASNTPSQPAPNKGTGFTNISQYLNENKDQAQGLTNQVVGKVSGSINNAQGQVDSATNNVNSAVSQATPVFNTDLFNKAGDNFLSLNDNEKQDILNQKNASYNGVKDATPLFNTANSAVNDAKNLAAQTESQSGRKDLLNNLETQGKQHTAGITSLNNLFLQNDPNSRGALSDVRAQASPLDQQLAIAQKNASDRITKAGADAKAVSDQANSALNATNNALTGVVQGQAQQRSNALNSILNFNNVPGSSFDQAANFSSVLKNSGLLNNDQLSQIYGNGDIKGEWTNEANKLIQEGMNSGRLVAGDPNSSTYNNIRNVVYDPSTLSPNDLLQSYRTAAVNELRNNPNYNTNAGILGQAILNGNYDTALSNIKGAVQNASLNSPQQQSIDLQKLLALKQILGEDTAQYQAPEYNSSPINLNLNSLK